MAHSWVFALPEFTRSEGTANGGPDPDRVPELLVGEVIFAEQVDVLHHLSPLGWEHIDVTGDYLWRHVRCQRVSSGSCVLSPRLSVIYRPFREVPPILSLQRPRPPRQLLLRFTAHRAAGSAELVRSADLETSLPRGRRRELREPAPCGGLKRGLSSQRQRSERPRSGGRRGLNHSQFKRHSAAATQKTSPNRNDVKLFVGLTCAKQAS